jgi:hypothetical protein
VTTSTMTAQGRLLVAVVGGTISLSVAGCSQVEGLATQANMNVIYVATASTDVLTTQSIPIQQAPRCTVDAAKLYTCNGTTADGRAILVLVPEDDSEDPQMTISVGGQQIFSGSVVTVLNNAAQATP